MIAKRYNTMNAVDSNGVWWMDKNKQNRHPIEVSRSRLYFATVSVAIYSYHET